MISREFNTLQIERSPSNIRSLLDVLTLKNVTTINNLTMTNKVKRYKLIKLASVRFPAEDIQ